MAFAPGTGLVLADNTGTIWRVTAAGGTEKLGAMEYVPRALAADPRGRLYVAGDAPRLARLSPGPPMRRIDMIDMPEAAPAGVPFVVSGNRLHFILPADSRFEIRSFRLR
jgi:hypothetical protein